MNSSLLAVAIAVAFAGATSLSFADTTSTSTANGGGGGAGGTATGGTATGGAATNNTSGVSSASGGVGQGGSGGSAAGGSANASGGSVGSVSTGGSNASTGDITVNYNLPAAASGKAGLGVGVDPTTGHIMTDNNINYQGSYKIKNTPDVNVGGPASGPCNGYSGGLGVSMAGFSIGANASTVDEGCSARETARIAAMMGRMDVANAILENLPIVQAAMKAKAEREALALPAKSSEIPATTAPAQFSPTPIPAPVLTQEQREAALREQQQLAQAALTRQATMAKVNDTLKFTDATTQSREKTPQQIMAEQANRELAKKAEEVKKPEPTLAAVASEPAQTDKFEMVSKPAETKASQESQTVSTPVVEQHGAGPATVKTTESKVSPAPQTPEERVKAAKAALNLQ